MIQVFGKASETTLGASPDNSKKLTQHLIGVSSSPMKYVAGELWGMYQKEGFLSYFEKKRLLSSNHKGLLIDAKNDLRLTEELSHQNILINATTGMGKTSRLIINMILDKAKNGAKNSMIILDAKGEIFDLTSNYLNRCGYKIYTLSPNDLDSSIGFNPFDFCHDSSDIEFVFRTLIYSSSSNQPSSGSSDKFWNEAALHILTLLGILLFSIDQKEHINLPNVKYLLLLIDKSPDNELDKLFIKYGSTEMIREYTRFKSYDETVLLNIVATASTVLSPIASNDKLKKILSSNSFDFTRFRKEKIALYIRISIQESDQYNFLVGSFISTMMYSELLKNPPLKRDLSLYLFIDEAGNYFIPKLDKYITVSRSYRLSWILAIQSIEMVENLYGRSGAEVILNGGVGTKVYFGNASNQLTNTLSNQIGKKQTSLFGKSVFEPVMQPSSIRTLPSEEVLVFILGNKPFIQKLYPYYELSKFKYITRKSPYKIKQRSVVESVKYIDMQGAL